MYYLDRRKNAWLLEVPPHGTITLKPGAPSSTTLEILGLHRPGINFHFRLYNLKPDSPHMLTCEGKKIGSIVSDSAGGMHSHLVLAGFCADFLEKVLIFEREGANPQQIASGYLERDL